MRRVQYAVMILTLCLIVKDTSPATAQACQHLESLSLNGLVSYLSRTVPDHENASCVDFAISQLGNQRYKPAVYILTKFLEFRWPADARQKQRQFVIEHDGFTIYPAATALEQIGAQALPAVLDVIKSTNTPREASEIAVEVWMQIHQNEAAKAVALLKQESDKSSDKGNKGRLNWAAFVAATRWCSPSEQTQCSIAAQTQYAASGVSSSAVQNSKDQH